MARKRSTFTRWIIRSLLLGMVLEVGLLLGGLELMGLKPGDLSKKIREVKKFGQGLQEAQKNVNYAVDILKGIKDGKDVTDLSMPTREKFSKTLSGEIELNPFALPKGVHTLKELEAMARKSEEESSAPEDVQKAVLKVTGIFLGRTQQTAIVGGNLLQVGDLIGGEQVFAINREGVVLEKDGNRRTLLPPALEGWMPAGEASPFPPLKKTKSSEQEEGRS